MGRARGIGLSRVADAAGVSIATVSNVLNRPEIVAPQTQQRVLTAMRQLDFVPNRAAATLRQGSNRLLGLVVPEMVNPFYAAITEAVARAAGREGYSLALCVSHSDPAVELRHFEMLAEQRAAGAIMLPLFTDDTRLKQLRMVGTHLVLIDRLAEGGNGCAVVMDDVLGGELAAEHLLRTAASPDLILVNGPHTIPQCVDRRAGVVRALESVGASGSAIAEYTSAHMTVQEGVDIGRRIDATAPVRVFCTNDQLAVGVIRGLREQGLRVPHDAQVVGYGDLDLATEGDVAITSIAQPKQQMGELAVQTVLAEIAEHDEHEHATTVLSPTLVVRDSAPAPN